MKNTRNKPQEQKDQQPQQQKNQQQKTRNTRASKKRSFDPNTPNEVVRDNEQEHPETRMTR